MMPTPPARSARSPALLLTLWLGAASCASNGSRHGPPEPDRDIHPIGEIVAADKKPESIGKFLTDLNNEIKAWNNLFLNAQDDAEKSRGRLMETHITTVTHQRRGEIIQELETGPLNNRIVAAAALGFTHDTEAQSPLIAALDDPHEEVVASALLGLWLLGRSDTPLERVCPLMTGSNNESVRGNAALLIMSLTAAGARNDCVLPATRSGLQDDAPTVRTHCAMVLATLEDTQSVQALIDRLSDDKPLVASAAARALTYLSAQDPHTKGVAARGLVKAWIASKEPLKAVIYRELVKTAGSNYGSDEKEWAKWADRLPSS